MPGDETRARIPDLVPLGERHAPALPKDESLRHGLRRLRDRVLKVEPPDPAIAEDRLARTRPGTLDRIAAGPAWGPVAAAMDAALVPWLDAGDGDRLRVLVLPPCEDEGLVAGFAARRGLDVLPAPPREALPGVSEAPDLGGDGVLVLPRLEDWLLRRHDALGAVRALLAALAATDRRCVVGCGAPAWAFLSRAAGAATLLPPPVTPRPLGAAGLRAWLAALLAAAPDVARTIRSSRTGDDVLALAASGEPANELPRRLAAASRGVPWIAWALWREALRDTPEADAADDALPEADDDRTLWAAELRDYPLPSEARADALTVVHALLLHRSLAPATLAAMLPEAGGAAVVPALRAAEIVVAEAGQLRLAPAAWPSMRRALSDAGHPIGAI